MPAKGWREWPWKNAHKLLTGHPVVPVMPPIPNSPQQQTTITMQQVAQYIPPRKNIQQDMH